MTNASSSVYCGNENRRERVRTTLGPGNVPLLNGIDYLEVANAAHTELELRFIHPLPGEVGGVPAGAPLAIENVRIEGGERIQGVRVIGVNAAGRVLTIEVDKAGDFSFYELKLVAGEGVETPPPGFDPQLARIRFSFRATCPSELDCRDEAPCDPVLPASPRIDYLARDYQSFRRVLLDRLRLLIPGFSETSPAAFPVALTELLAYVGDHLSYAQDAVATETYLGTARHRVSVRRHARLRNYRMHEGCNARALVQLDVEPLGAADGADLAVGTRFFAGSSDQLKLALAGELSQLKLDRCAIFEAMEPLRVRAAHNRFELYTYGDDECVLCEGATRATLVRPAGAELAAGMMLVFEEARDPTAPAGHVAAGRLTQRCAVRLTTVTETNDPLDGTLLYEVAWSPEDALPISLVISRRVDDLLIESISIARGNIVLADHGLSLLDSDEEPALEPPQAPVGGSRYAPRLPRPDLTFSEDFGKQPLSVAKSLAQDPRLARPQLWLEANGERWSAALDLLGSEHDAPEYVVEMDDQRRAHLRFGDGEHGRRVPTGQRFSARYRVGNGAVGNVGPEAIIAALVPGGGFARVRNPLPARGGADFEALEDVKQYAPVAFKTQRRAVTLADYEAAAKLYPGVQQARAEFRWLASWYTVVIAIDRVGGEKIKDDFRAGFLAFMETRRMAGYDIELRDPEYVPLDVTVRVCLRKGASRSAVLRALSERLGSGPRGLFHPDRLTFGQRVYVSPILEAAAAIAGVDHARMIRFKRFRKPAAGELSDGFLDVAGHELPQLANDPSFPERGVIRFELEGGV